MVDILYIVGKGCSDWRNNELRYSLRSLAKYGRNIRRVYIAGFIPYWVDDTEVYCIPVKDETNSKHYNILHAIEQAVERGNLNELFLYSSDDHFYTQPTDFDTYPCYWRDRELPSELPEHPRWYDITMKSTHDVLKAFDLPRMFFAWHGNTWFNARLFNDQRFMLLRRLAQTMEEGCDPSTLMLNYWLATEPNTMPKMIGRADGKVTPAATIEQIAKMAKEKEVISSTDAAGAALRLWLREEFPNKCKYERND